ncbi:hypothetical protein JTE88_07470 [Arcanobacterium phocisimile]|uniref:Uncharacterized protein n=1 Tax=Arcanobacterium phocisimile TaxID=1302235 RepID=A0ABX7IIH1_9ACTO|nr:hypothetical protein [Arcanobacterium phocisimile]QRV01910.1 hypothetical protein JTE88_07470 [Arcanobacterium phocisimile]
MEIISAAFTESETGRSLSWDVRGCSVQNKRTVVVDVLLGGRETKLRKTSRKENVNASQWPTGKYTVVAKCINIKTRETLHTKTLPLELTRANLATTFAGEELSYLIPRPEAGYISPHTLLTTHYNSKTALNGPGFCS